MLVAMANGFDKKHGIEVKPVTVASGADLARGTISGDISIALNSPPNVIALLDQGVDVVAFGKTLTASNFDLIVRSDVATPNSDSGWQGTLKDLAGKRIGVVARGVAAEDIIKSMFKAAGVDPDKQSYIATGLAPTTIAALTNKQIDAAFNVEPTISLAIQQGLGRSPFALRRGDGPDNLRWPGVIATTLRDYAKKNPEVLKGFIETYEESVKWVNDPANKATLYKLMADKLGTEAALNDVLFKENTGAFPSSVALTTKEVQAFLDWSNSTGTSLVRHKPSDLLYTL